MLTSKLRRTANDCAEKGRKSCAPASLWGRVANAGHKGFHRNLASVLAYRGPALGFTFVRLALVPRVEAKKALLREIENRLAQSGFVQPVGKGPNQVGKGAIPDLH